MTRVQGVSQVRPPPGTNSPAELLRSAGDKQKTEEEQDPRYKNIDMKMVELIKNEIMDQVKCFVCQDRPRCNTAGVSFRSYPTYPQLVLASPTG